MDTFFSKKLAEGSIWKGTGSHKLFPNHTLLLNARSEIICTVDEPLQHHGGLAAPGSPNPLAGLAVGLVHCRPGALAAALVRHARAGLAAGLMRRLRARHIATASICSCAAYGCQHCYCIQNHAISHFDTCWGLFENMQLQTSR